jgi:pilus assembly protein Flp/PilA
MLWLGCAPRNHPMGDATMSTLRRDCAGVTAIEYGLIVGAIAIAILATVFALGGDIADLFGTVGSTIGSSNGSGAS